MMRKLHKKKKHKNKNYIIYLSEKQISDIIYREDKHNIWYNHKNVLETTSRGWRLAVSLKQPVSNSAQI